MKARSTKHEARNESSFGFRISDFGFSAKQGFTLIETLVAVSIMTLAIAGPLYTANRAIVAAQNSRDQLIASYLAQEGIEYVRMKRDNAYLVAYRYREGDTSNAWIDFLASVASCRGATCTLDPNQGLAPFSGNAPLYLTDTSPHIYNQQGTGTKTVFTRTIQVKYVTDTDEQIVSKVLWSFHGTQYTVTITDHLTPWQ